MEKKYCLGSECPDKRCELCTAEHSHQLDVTDSFRVHPSVSKSGYYSSGGIIRIYDPKTGKYRYAYGRLNGD